MKLILVAAAFLTALAVSTAARATPVPHSFSVTATSGPLNGVTETGTFTYDSSSIVPGSANVSAGLLTSLNFTWNGITYDQTTANTGTLGFIPHGDLASALFGTNCGAGTCTVYPGTNTWDIGFPNFRYGTPQTGLIFDGTATFSPAPGPSVLHGFCNSVTCAEVNIGGNTVTGNTPTRSTTSYRSRN